MKTKCIVTIGCLLVGLALMVLVLSGFARGYLWLLILMSAFLLLSALHMVFPKTPPLNPKEIADVIERFLDDKSLYPQEWNDFVEHSQADKEMDRFRKRCDELDPLVNSHDPQDQEALRELRAMVKELREMKTSV